MSFFCPTHTLKTLEGHLSPPFLAEGRRDPQRVLVLILITTHMLYIYIYVLTNIGLVHLGWEILPGPIWAGWAGPDPIFLWQRGGEWGRGQVLQIERQSESRSFPPALPHHT